jgi:hypothetical protein
VTPGRVWCRRRECCRVASDEAWTVSGAVRRGGGSAAARLACRGGGVRRLGRRVRLGPDRLPASGPGRGRPVGGAQRHRLGDRHRSGDSGRCRCSGPGSRSGSRPAGQTGGRSGARSGGTGCSRSTSPDRKGSPSSPRRSNGHAPAAMPPSTWSWRFPREPTFAPGRPPARRGCSPAWTHNPRSSRSVPWSTPAPDGMPRPPVDYDAELRLHNQVLRRACGVRRHDHVLDVGCGPGRRPSRPRARPPQAQRWGSTCPRPRRRARLGPRLHLHRRSAEAAGSC